MNNLILERIKKQTRILAPSQKPLPVKQEIKVVPTPMDPEVLRNKFMNEFTAPEPVVNQEVERLFLGIEDFVSWYERNSTKFTEPQQVALNTLIPVRNMINTGCQCQRYKRKEKAEDFYSYFWTQNKNTDLPLSVANILDVQTVKFLKDGVNFLTFSK